MRLKSLILPTILLAATAAPAFAQDGTEFHVGSFTDLNGPRLASPATPDPNFPLRVWVRLDRNYWDGSYDYYSGFGKFLLAGTSTQPVHFEYDCTATFARPLHTQFQARWITPGKKLQVLFAPVDKFSKPRTCTLTATNRRPLPIPRNVNLPTEYDRLH